MKTLAKSFLFIIIRGTRSFDVNEISKEKKKGSEALMVTIKELREEFESKLNRQLTTEEINVLNVMIDSQYHRRNEAFA
ncbi:hypothetical protein [Halalkalibacter okhensis]|uniref:hypothetical protein n=1 Tax=Halalkalibacter okhensis TaxID=333138 RepID=UPI00126A165C|nr:hypothetical protein [Halalkalibacter okhensis]